MSLFSGLEASCAAGRQLCTAIATRGVGREAEAYRNDTTEGFVCWASPWVAMGLGFSLHSAVGRLVTVGAQQPGFGVRVGSGTVASTAALASQAGGHAASVSIPALSFLVPEEAAVTIPSMAGRL